MRWDGTGWVEMGCYGMEWDMMGRGGVEWDGILLYGMGCDVMRRDGM